MNILIVGASGNLGTHIARHLRAGPHQLRLMTHRTPPVGCADTDRNVSIIRADLNVPATLDMATRDIDCIVYLAGVLFRPRPETFLHRTNTIYVQNIVDAAISNQVAGVRLRVARHGSAQPHPTHARHDPDGHDVGGRRHYAHETGIGNTLALSHFSRWSCDSVIVAVARQHPSS